MAVRVQEAASLRLDDTCRCTPDRWGAEQADHYIADLFAAFDRSEGHGVASRPIPAEFGGEGFYFRHEHDFVYWRRFSDGDIGVVTILHERMHQTRRFRDDLGCGGAVPAFDQVRERHGHPEARDGFWAAPPHQW